MESEDDDGEGDEDAGAGTGALAGSWQWCAAREVLAAVYSTCVSRQRSVVGKGRGRRAVYPRVLAAVCYRESWPLYSALKVLAVVLPAGRRADVFVPRNLTGIVIFSIK